MFSTLFAQIQVASTIHKNGVKLNIMTIAAVIVRPTGLKSLGATGTGAGVRVSLGILLLLCLGLGFLVYKERKTRRNISKIPSQGIGDAELVGEKTCCGSQAYAAQGIQHETEGGEHMQKLGKGQIQRQEVLREMIESLDGDIEALRVQDMMIC